MNTDTAEIHRKACQGLASLVDQIGDAQWGLPTPNTEWDVRALVEHVMYGTAWVPPLIAGETIAEVGDRFEGDLLGDDPKASFRAANQAAIDAVLEPGALERTVDLSSGPTPAANYVRERIADAAMHTWDLARSIGADETIDPDVVASGRGLLARVGDLWRKYGALGPVAPTGPDASEQDLFIAESGRDPAWSA